VATNREPNVYAMLHVIPDASGYQPLSSPFACAPVAVRALPRYYDSQNGVDPMRKKLSAIGNSLGIVIEKPILELLDIDRETELDMRTDGERLIIEPIRAGKRAKVKAAVQRAMAAHDATLRKLAK